MSIKELDLSMGEEGIYPWQLEQWENLCRRLSASRLPHALLLHGERGIGLDHFALQFVKVLLCLSASTEKPCGNCRGCILHAGGNHPDFFNVASQKDGEDIKIAQIRALTDYLQSSRHYGNFKVVLVEHADAMNRAAANALLKTLEEPPTHTFIALTSNAPFRMPATVRSRCQSVRLSCSDHLQARAWLSRVENIDNDEAERRLIAHRWRPLHASNVKSAQAEAGKESICIYDFLSDINYLCEERINLVEVSEKWHKHPSRQIQNWFLELVEIAIRQQIKTPSPEISLRRLFSFYDRQKYRYMSQRVHFDSRLLIESALVEWQSVYPRRLDEATSIS